MSVVSLRQLLDADAAPVAAAAVAWQAMAEELDNAAEQLIRGTRDLEDAWPEGPASQSAHAKTAQLRAEVSNAYNPCRRIFQALRGHADALASLQETARSIVDDARRTGLLVDVAAGTVRAPQSMYEGPAPHATAQLVSGYAHQLSDVVAQAAALDDRTTNAINANLPDARTGFGSLTLPPVSRADLESQRGRPPKDVNAWWLSLTPEQQEQAIADHPDLVGWLDGVPATDRDTANRISLGRHEDDLQRREDDINRQIAQLRAGIHPGSSRSELEGIGRQILTLTNELNSIDATQVSLAKVDAALAKLGDKGLLLGIDPAGDGKAIVAVGNPDTARHTAVWVPGLGTTLDSTRGNVDRVLHLQEAADRLTPGQGEVATVMWLGYDAPELDHSVVTGERSRQGAEPLSQFVGGLRATHGDGSYHVTAVGHSYGSTVVGEAALSGRLPVDDIVTAGSPGTHAEHAGDLMTDPRHVWAGSAEDDPVSNPVEHHGKYLDFIPIVGPFLDDAEDDGHGPSPHYDDFGANRYVVDTSGHSDYWNPGSESIENQARVIVGKYSRTGLEHGQAPPDLP
ncbi:alpha/beta hydrolase [Micromonospora sp. NPDC049679]|uniref:alpha/beta hydrolase n=1 Tax=Micromonospora sp. NPDC049679 TaxID=3155920 RepID=UPI0033DD0574